MSNFQFNLGNPKSSGKSGRNFSPVVLILFGVPFLLMGLIALAAVIHNPKQQNALVGFSGGGIFVCVGIGIMIAGFRLRKKAKQTADLQAQNPGKPWLWRADWAEGKIKSSALVQPILMLILGLGFCALGGVATGFALPEVWQKHNYAALVVLLFPLAGIALLAAFLAAWRSQRRFGKCYFELAQIPIPLGGVLEGMIQTGAPLRLEHELHLKISCVRRVVTGSGKGRSVNEYILWQNEKIYSEQAALPEPELGHTGIPVHFKLPDDQPECYSRGNESVFWRLEAKTKMRGPDFHTVFEVPVFKIAGAETVDEAGAPDADPTVGLQAPVEEIRREEHSRIKITDGPNGRDFYFPPARNVGAALLTTLGMFIFNGSAVLLFHFGAPIIFPIVFGLVGILLILSTFSMWLKSSHVTIDATTVRLTSHGLIFSRTRQFSASDVAHFATKAGMQSGSKVFTDIKLIKRGAEEHFAANTEKFQEAFQDASIPEANKVVARFRQAAGPSGVTVASSIASVAEANWLVAEMNKALGRKS